MLLTNRIWQRNGISLLRLGFKKNGSFCLAHLVSPALDLSLALMEACTAVSSVVERPTWQELMASLQQGLHSAVNNLMSELGSIFPRPSLEITAGWLTSFFLPPIFGIFLKIEVQLIYSAVLISSV